MQDLEGLNAPLPCVPGLEDRIGVKALEVDADRFHLPSPPEEDLGVITLQETLRLEVCGHAFRALVMVESCNLRGLQLRVTKARIIVTAGRYVLTHVLRAVVRIDPRVPAVDREVELT